MRLLAKAGRWFDELLFGGEHEREIEWVGGGFILLVLLFLLWQFTR